MGGIKKEENQERNSVIKGLKKDRTQIISEISRSRIPELILVSQKKSFFAGCSKNA
jgi:hypothetical protein